MLLCTVFSPERHQIIDNDIIRYCRENCSDDKLRAKLFLYFHRIEQTYVIAAWTDNSKRRFCDLFNMGFDIHSFDRAAAMEFLRKIGEPYTLKQISKDMANADRDAIRAAEERQEYHHEREAKLREATGYERPDPLLRE
jgi:hypothetical protein